TTEFVRLEPTLTAGQALERIRTLARDYEQIYACYIFPPDGHELVGVVSLRDLVMADVGRLVGEVMHPRPITVLALEDQESVAQKIGKYNLLAVPVLEADGAVIGLVTVDDIIDVMVEEQTEDVLR